MNHSTKITFVGHATTLIESDGMSILTDPNFAQKLIFIKRKGELRYDPKGLPDLSAVVVSHTHLDHLDFTSFNYIQTTVPIVVPEGSGRRLSQFLPNPVIELSCWSHHEFNNGLKIHAVPAVHGSGKFYPYFFRNASGYVFEIGGKTIFFAGDTAYGAHFHDIGNTYSIDAALLPIGGYKPAFIMKRFHMDPVEAVQAFLDLKTKLMIPIHWGAFRLSFERPDEPVEWLKKVIAERRIEDKVKILEPGGDVEI